MNRYISAKRLAQEFVCGEFVQQRKCADIEKWRDSKENPCSVTSSNGKR
jgi:hypothetical protein